jgi:histidine kinase
MREYSKQIIDEAFKNRKAIIISNAATDEKYGKYDGVSDFSLKSILCMPIRHHERPIGICYLDNPLSTNVFSDEDNEIMNVLMTQAAISIENASLYANLEEKVRQRTEQLKKAMDSLWGELELAKKIQTALLPERPGIDGYEITGFMKTADEVGGDYYDVVNAGGRDWIVIGDVSGHGITAGLIMMMVQTAIHIALDLSPGLPPSQLLENINRTISENMKKLGGSRFMTITVLMSAGDGVFHFAGLHENILVYRAESGLVESVNTEGMWIGLHEDIKGKMKDKSLKLEEGDMIPSTGNGIQSGTCSVKTGSLRFFKDWEEEPQVKLQAAY